MVLYPNKLPESERVCSGICSEAVYGVSSVNKIAVKKECARIRGVDHTLTWKIKILGKQVEYGIKQIIEYLIPASFLKEMKIRNRKRLEHRK